MNNLAFFSFSVKRFFSFVRVYLYVVFRSVPLPCMCLTSEAVRIAVGSTCPVCNSIVELNGVVRMPLFKFCNRFNAVRQSLLVFVCLTCNRLQNSLAVSPIKCLHLNSKKKLLLALFGGLVTIFNYVITFGKVKNYKALFSRLHLNLSILKVSFWGYKCIV